MKKLFASFVVLLGFTSAMAQNTSREPMQGGAANPVTQHEADQNSDQKPLSEIVRKKKKKPDTTITAEPVDGAKKPATKPEVP